jgi:hypothetical protein
MWLQHCPMLVWVLMQRTSLQMRYWLGLESEYSLPMLPPFGFGAVCLEPWSEEATQAPGTPQSQSPAQAILRPDTASSRGVQGQPNMAGVYAAKEPMPGVQRG